MNKKESIYNVIGNELISIKTTLLQNPFLSTNIEKLKEQYPEVDYRYLNILLNNDMTVSDFEQELAKSEQFINKIYFQKCIESKKREFDTKAKQMNFDNYSFSKKDGELVLVKHVGIPISFILRELHLSRGEVWNNLDDKGYIYEYNARRLLAKTTHKEEWAKKLERFNVSICVTSIEVKTVNRMTTKNKKLVSNPEDYMNLDILIYFPINCVSFSTMTESEASVFDEIFKIGDARILP